MATNKPRDIEAIRQLNMIMQSLGGYRNGNPNISSLSESSVTAPKESTSSPRIDPVNTQAQSKEASTNNTANVNRALGWAGLAAALAGDPSAAQAIGLTRTGVALADPNRSIESKVPGAVSLAGMLTGTNLGGLAGLAGMALNGVSTPGLMGLLGMVNPAIGIAGLANSLAGNPIGEAGTRVGNTFGNPNSVAAAEAAGVSRVAQAYNAVNNSQTDKDTAGMDRLSASLSGPDSGSYTGSRTFQDGEQVVEWKYCEDIFKNNDKPIK